MKWGNLLNDIKGKVGLSPSSQRNQQFHPFDPSPLTPSSPGSSSWFRDGNAVSAVPDFAYSSSSPRDKHELELDFKRFWEEFRSSSSEKEKEVALNMSVDAFCKLVKQQANVAQLVETNIFSFVVGRAFVTDIEKLMISNKRRSLDVLEVLHFFSEVTKDGINPGSNFLNTVEVLVSGDGINPGSNFLNTVEVLVSGPMDKQPLLDSGILCCLIHILNALLGSDGTNPSKMMASDHSRQMLDGNDEDKDVTQSQQLEIEGKVVHIMKALASHPSSAQGLVEDDSLQLLFHMIVNKSLNVFSQQKDDLVSLHSIQLHRHAMQILSLLLVNDNGSTAKYISKHHLIKVLLTVIKDFNPACGDAAYTMSVVELLYVCVELSYRPEAGGVRLREDIHNAHGYQFLVQFALTLSAMSKSQSIEDIDSDASPDQYSASDDLQKFASSGKLALEDPVGDTTSKLSPVLSRLLDVVVNLAQLGPAEPTGMARSSTSSHAKGGDRRRTHTSSNDLSGDEIWETNNTKVKDLEAVQMLQDIFLKAESTELQAEVLNRMFQIFSSHVENYKLCQQLRTMPLCILNMGGFPPPLQDTILKILEYAVTVVNCMPEQELLSLSCLLQQPITTELNHTILSFFVKLVSFDQQYKRLLQEVGVLELLLDDLKSNSYFLCSDPENIDVNKLKSSFKKHLDSNDVIISSPRLLNSSSGRIPLFKVDSTVSIAWDCMVSLLKKTEANQSSFRSANGVAVVLPFLVSDVHRQGVLRTLSCLITEDMTQTHPEELGALLEVLKSGIVTSAPGVQYVFNDDAKCEIFGALWRILGANSSAQRVFGEATGFSLIFTTLHGLRSAEGKIDQSSRRVYIKVFTYLMRVMTAGVCGNAVNRTKLLTIISSHSFYDLLCESGLICIDLERQVIHLLLELALEIVIPPFLESEADESLIMIESSSFTLMIPTGVVNPDSERIYNAGAVIVIIRALLLFTPKVQLEVLGFIEKLAHAGPFNLENLTAVGCVELLLDIIQPYLLGSSPLLSHALRIIEILGAYRLSTSELRLLMRYILQMRQMSSGCNLAEMMERLILLQDMASGNVSLAPFMKVDMSKVGHACIQVSLGVRSWPPVAGYSFVCWFQHRNFFKSQSREHDHSRASSRKQFEHKQQVLRLFSVGSVDSGSTFYAELYLQEDGLLTLATSNSSSISFSDLELVEGRWHHLAVVHSKPNALAGFFQASVAYVYVDGKLRHTGKLGYSPSPVGKVLQITIGTPHNHARVSGLQWKLRCCYLFEEVLSPGSVCFMYILGRGYRGLFQDTDLLQFVPNQACGGDRMAVLDSLEADQSLASGAQRPETTPANGSFKADVSGMVWDLERLGNLSLQLSGKKLIFAFDGTCTEPLQASGTLSLLNLVDPDSAAASPIGGIPRFGRLYGDVYICRQSVIGDTVHSIGGMTAVLALVEAAETKEMLHMALTLLACALHQNPRNLREMQACRGYHLLSLFLYRRMSLFDMYCLEIFFKMAACEASFSESKKLEISPAGLSPEVRTLESILDDDIDLSKFRKEFSSIDFQGDADNFSAQKETYVHISELDNDDGSAEKSNCIVLSNADMVKHVLVDWTLWVTAPVSIQIALLGFLEHLVSIHWYRYHNLTILRRIDLVQHLLVTLQRGDVELPVLEKLVILLGVILEDGFLASELETVVRFVIMTFDPPEVTIRYQIPREPMGKHVIVRNMLLEMLIDLQVTIKAADLLEQWHKIVSSKLITYFLDEAVHPTSMRWIMTLLGVSLTSSPTFQLKFRIGGGYQGLTQVLASFYDSPDIYYILFCLIFGKPVYPRLPEVRMLDFHALLPGDGNHIELKFVELLDSVIAMVKFTFDCLSMRLMLAHQSGKLSMTELADENAYVIGELQGNALMHKTYAARLMGGEAYAPTAATSVLRFMVDLAKMCPAFSYVCRRAEILESSVGLYFSCARASYAVKMAKNLSPKTEDKNVNDCEVDNSSQNESSSLPQKQEQSAKTSIGAGSFIQGQASMSSGDIPLAVLDMDVEENPTMITSTELSEKEILEELDAVLFGDDVVDGHAFTATGTNVSTSENVEDTLNVPTDSQSSASITMLDSPIVSEKSSARTAPTSSATAFSSWPGGSAQREEEAHLTATPSVGSSVTTNGGDLLPDAKSNSQGASSGEAPFLVDSELVLEIDGLGYGGGPCTAGATAVLDFIAEVLSDILTEQIKAVSAVECILECAPLYADTESMLAFQGLCFSRIMNFLERRLLRDDEETEKKLDKNRWASNLEAFCWLIVDRVYMGAFPQPAAVLRILEFLLSMLQLANKDGRIEEATPVAGKGLLSIGRGSRLLDSYIHAILKNTNRMILFCFLPSFLSAIGEEDLLCTLGLLSGPTNVITSASSLEDTGLDISTVLQLLNAHMRLIFCPSSLDTDLNCCLCINLISLLRYQRQNVMNMAIDILKYLLMHRRAALEDFLVSKPNQGPRLDVLHGGFDKLLTGNLSSFLEWFRSSEQDVNKVLEKCAGIMWIQYIVGSSKFPGVRIKGMDARRIREMERKSNESSMSELKHWEQLNERRCALEFVRDAMSTELRVVRQDKYGWVLHAESEWQTHLQHLAHERGIFPVCKTPDLGETEWQLCPIEGPYRMRKKLERCKLRVHTTLDILDRKLEVGASIFSNPQNDNMLDVSDSGSFSQFVVDSMEVPSFADDLYSESSIRESDSGRDFSSRTGLQDDHASSINEPSLHSAIDFGAKSTEPVSDISLGRYGTLNSPRQSSSVKNDDVRVSEERSEKELLDNGEYLIRPYLEPLEKIRFKYNCERVVGLDKHDGIFLIGELCLYVIENFYVDDSGCICEKASEDELSVIDQALGVKKDISFSDFQSKSTSSLGPIVKTYSGGRAWAYNGGAWGKEKVCTSGNLHHLWHMWKLNSVHELLKRDYQLRPVAIEIFSMDGCNDLLVFHKKEREEVFKNLVGMNLPRNSMLDITISGSTKQESNDGSLLFKLMTKSFSTRWQNGEISNFQYLMHLNTLAGRGYSDLTQYPVFPWVLADYDSEDLDLSNPLTFRKLDKPVGCQTAEGEEEFRKRYDNWDDPDVPKFHYGSHYSSAGTVLFYLLRLPPFSTENQKLQGGQFDHADRLFSSVRDTWLSAAGKGNTSDVKELIPEFFYMPEFLENHFGHDLGEKQSGEKVGDVVLPPWAKGSSREFIRKHRQALESDYVSDNLHHWIDLIFGYKQRGKAAEEAVNVFYHYTYEGNVDIDSITEPAMKAAILAQINHFGQTPKQLFVKPHVKRQSDINRPPLPLKYSSYLAPRELKKTSSSIVQIVTLSDKILVAGSHSLLKPRTYEKYVKWGFPDLSLRFMSYDQDRLLSTHENLHGGSRIQCTGISHDGRILVTGGEEGLVCVWRIRIHGPRAVQHLQLEKALSAHTARISCLRVCQPYMLLVTGSDDHTVIFWDLSSLAFVRQLPEFPSPISSIYVNDLTGEVITAAGVLLAIWSINADCLAVINTTQLPSDSIVSVTSCTFSDWLYTNWYVTGHQSGAVKIWRLIHCSVEQTPHTRQMGNMTGGLALGGKIPEYRLVLHKQLKHHKYPVTAVHLTNDLKQLLTGDSDGHLLSWTLPEESLRGF